MPNILERTSLNPRSGNPPLDQVETVSRTRLGDYLTLPDHVISGWDTLARSAIRHDRIAQLHEARDQYRDVINEWIGNLERFYGIVKVTFDPHDGNDLDILAAFQVNLRRLREFSAQLFGRWTSLEDLERILAELIALPNERLLELALRFPPPKEWLERDEPRPW